MIRNRPLILEPAKSNVRVVQMVKDNSAIPNVCHVGLGITASNNVRVLRGQGWQAEAWPIQETSDKRAAVFAQEKLQADYDKSVKNGEMPVSHVIISAPSWINAEELKKLAGTWPNIEFVQQNHSGNAFLSVDVSAVKNIRDTAALSTMMHNVRLAANCDRVRRSFDAMFTAKSLFLPNLYDVNTFTTPYAVKRVTNRLRVGVFGAPRPLKNVLNAAAAALQLSLALGCDLELHMNSGREDTKNSAIESIKELFANQPSATLVWQPWANWAGFRATVRTMNILFQPSFTESFNVVTADGIAEGVPSVVGPAIEWVPARWKADPDDPQDMVRCAIGLLNDPQAVNEGRKHLVDYVAAGVGQWENWLMRRDSIF